MTAAYVATFYSFKGGVGRTTLLVNVAHALAAQGERVVIWDLDLEAPGVHLFPGLEPPDRLWQSGFLEWLGDTPPCPTVEPTAAWPPEPSLKLLGDRVYAARGKDRGEIFVVPAHGTFANLGRAYAAVDWHGLFVQHPAHGLHLLSRVRDELMARFEPRYLLIDSRTGISDLGGFVTGLLPDCTVLVGNYSAQSTEGLRSVYLALDRFATERVKAEPYRRHKLERVLVASPVPTSQSALERGRARWASGFPGVAPRTLIEVPLVESLLYAEEVLVRIAPSSDAATAYRAVAARLSELRKLHERSGALGEAAAGPTRLVNVEHLLRLLGFETAVAGDTELVARRRTPLGDHTHLVSYVAGTARMGPALRDLLDRLRNQRGSDAGEPMLIVDAVRDDARGAAQAAGIMLRTVGELEDQLLDRRAYAAMVRRGFEDSELARSYVTPRVVVGGTAVDGLAHAMAWAAGRGPRLMVIEAEAGTGRTSFVRRLAYELAVRFDSDPAAPVPLVIDLGCAGASATLDGLAQDHLRTAIGWYGNPEAIRYLLAAGRLVALLDGLDELAFGSAASTADHLRRLAGPTAGPGSAPAANRMLVTTSPEATRGTGAPGEPDCQTVVLAPFDDAEIAKFLVYRLGGARAQAAVEAIAASPQLRALAARPLWLRLLAEGGADLAAVRPDPSVAALYERYVRQWLARVAPEPGLASAEHAIAVEQLAVELSRRGEPELPGAQLAELADLADLADVADVADLADLPRQSAHQLDVALRSAPFVTRSTAGAYGFSHHGFLEYFLACRLVRCARAGVDALRDALVTARLTPGCTARFAELAAADGDVPAAVRGVSAGPYTAEASENAIRLAAMLGQEGGAG